MFVFRYLPHGYNVPSHSKQEVPCGKLSDGCLQSSDSGRGHTSRQMSCGYLSSPGTLFQRATRSVPSHFPSGCDWIPSVCLPHGLRKTSLVPSTPYYCCEVQVQFSPDSVLEHRGFAGKQSWLRIAIQMGK